MTKSKTNKYGYLAQNTLLFTISSFSSKILTFFLVPLYTNILSTEDYSTADIITTSAMILMYVFTLNISSAVLRFAIDSKENKQRVLFYGFKVIFTGAAVVLVGMIFFWAFNLIKWESYCYIFLFLTFLADSLQTMLYQYLRAIDKVKMMTVSSILSTLVRLLSCIVTLVVFKMGVLGYLLSMFMGPFVSTILPLCTLLPFKKEPVDKEYDKQLHKGMRKYSIPLIFNQLGWWINNSINKYFIIWLKGAALNGVFAVSYKIANLMSMLCNIFCQAWGISAIKEFDKNDKDGFFAKVYGAFSAGLAIACSGLILVNIPLSKILFAKDFFEAWQYSSLLVLAMLFSGLSSFLGGIFSAAKENKSLATTTFIAAIINVALNLVLIPNFDAMGAAVATAISFYFVWLLRLLFSRKYMKFKINLIRDHLVYLLIVLQIILEHTASHMYIAQCFTFVAICLLYFKQLKMYYEKVVSFILTKLKSFRANNT